MPLQERQVYEWEGRRYLRMGECVRCGECCKGFSEPCPHLRHGPEYACEIYDRRGETLPTGIINPPGCVTFPDGPQALWHPAFQKCGYWFMEVERVLVACPTYIGKDYCKARYLSAYEALDWPAKTLLMVDTTDDERYPGNGNQKIARGMEEIRRAFLAGPYDRWLNLEADIIAPPETLRVLLSYDPHKEMDWISHWYPDRVTQVQNTAGFGCTMFSRRLLERHSFEGAPVESTTDGWFWNEKVNKDRDMKALDIWGVLNLEHLNG